MLLDVRSVTCGRCGESYDPVGAHTCAAPRTVVYADDVALAPIWDLSESHATRHRVALSLSVLRYEQGFLETDMHKVKEFTSECIHAANEDALVRLAHLLKPDASMADVRAALNTNIFDGLSTADQELAHASTGVPIINAREVVLSNKATVVSFRLADLFIRKLTHDKAFRKRVIAKSEEWKTGNNFEKRATELSDLDSGERMRFHPHAMRPATVDEARDLRICWLFQCDDIEVRSTSPHTHTRTHNTTDDLLAHVLLAM